MPNEMKRMNYFNGLMLKEEDLTLDQEHHMRLQRIHNRYFHNWGVVYGLSVKAVDAMKVEVAPGMALNRIANPDDPTDPADNKEEIAQEIVVGLNHPGRILDLTGYSTSDQIYITVSYDEQLTDPDLLKGGGKEIHVTAVPVIRSSSSKPADVRKDVLLARITLKHNLDGILEIDQVLTTDTDGKDLVTYAVGGTTLKAKKIIIGSKEDPALPYFSGGSEETGSPDKGKLYVNASQTEFKGSVRSGPINTFGAVDVNGVFTVTSGTKQALKVNSAGDLDVAGSATVGSTLRAKSGIEVSGGQAMLDVPQVVITGNMVTVNKKPSETANSGIEICRKDHSSAKLVWDEADKTWKIGTDVEQDDADSGMHKVAYGKDWETLHNGSNADVLHKHSHLYDTDGNTVLTANDDGAITVEKSLTVNGSLIAKSGGLEVSRGETLPNAKIAWNEDKKKWQIGTVNGDMTDIPDGKMWEDLTGGNVNADALHTHSQFHNEDQSMLALEIEPDGNVSIPHDLMVGETLTVNKLVVKEEQVLIRKVEQEVADSYLTVNKGEDGSVISAKGGLDVYRGADEHNARIEWSETDKKWKVGVEGGMSDIPYGSKWDSLTNGSAADEAHKHSTLSTPSGGAVLSADDQGKVTAAGNVAVNGTLDVKDTASLSGNLNVGGSATIEGDLTVKGKTTFVEKQDMVIKSNKIELNRTDTNSSSPLNNSSIEVFRGNANPSARLVWDEKALRWKLGLGDAVSNIAYGDNWDVLTGGVTSDGDGLHRHSSLGDKDGNPIVQVNANADIEIKNDAEVKGTLTVNNGLDVTGGIAVDGPVTINGDLLVNGTPRKIEKEDLVITNNIIEINKFEGDVPLVDESGLEVFRGETLPAARIIWDESERKWKVGIGASLENIASGNSWDKLTQAENADSLHNHSQLYNSQGDVLTLSSSAEGDVDVHHDLTVGSSLTVAGNLDVRGALASINTDKLQSKSAKVTLNKSGSDAASTEGGGLEVFRGADEPAAQIIWEEAAGQWRIGTSAANPALLVDKDGNATATGGVKAASAEIAGVLTADSGKFGGMSITNEGLEIPQGVHTSALIKWVNDCWKLGTSDLTALSLTRDGYVGIGTNVPTSALDVQGKAQFQSADFSGAVLFTEGLTSRETANFEKKVNALDMTVNNDLAVKGKLTATHLLAKALEAPRGQAADGTDLPNAAIEWDNTTNKWYYSDGSVRSEIGSSAGSMNKMYNEKGDAIAIFADAEAKVGIGTTKPLALLDVKIKGGAPAFSVSKDGYVGIGTDKPKTKLDVQGDAAVTGNLSVSGNLTVEGDVVTINTAMLEVEDNIVRVNKYPPQATPLAKNGGLEVFRGGTAKEAQLLWDEANLRWVAGTSDSLKAIEFKGHTHPEITDITNTLKIVSGNVGIGNANPTAKLDVTGNAKVSGRLTAGELEVTTSLSLENVTIGHSLSAQDATVSGSLTANNVDVNGILSVSQGMEVDRGSAGAKAQILWSETDKAWQAGTAGGLKQLEFAGHTHAELTTLTGALKVDAGNVGIGTSAPKAKLDVNGNAAVSGDAAVGGKLNAAGAEFSNAVTAKSVTVSQTMTADNATVWGAFAAGSATVTGALTAGGATVASLTAAAATVSGTLSAKDATVSGDLTAANVKVSGALEVSNGLVQDRGSSAPKAQILWNETLKEWQLGAIGDMKRLSYDGHTHAELTTLTGTLKVDAGKVGIGTDTPKAKLDVNGSASITGDAAVSGGITAAQAAISGAFSALNATVGNSLTVKDASFSGSLSAHDVTVNGSLTLKDGLEVGREAPGVKARLIWNEAHDAWEAGLADDMKELEYKGHTHDGLDALTEAFTVDADLNVGVGKAAADGYKLDIDGNLRATNFSQTSSRTFKESIASLPAKKALELLNKLKPVTFSYKKDQTKRQNIGFIAEEVPDVFATSDHKSVVLMDIIGVLTTVVQKQQKEAAELQKQVHTLQKQVASLAGM